MLRPHHKRVNGDRESLRPLEAELAWTLACPLAAKVFPVRQYLFRRPGTRDRP